ncbi:hypothetical protein GEMRC1_008306 [Eukaryota sp. GEM-RC1]
MLNINLICIVCNEDFNFLERIPLIVCPENHTLCKQCTTQLLKTQHCPSCRSQLIHAPKPNRYVMDLLHSVRSGECLTELPLSELVVNPIPIGEGSFATIFAGTWFGLDVAIKVIRFVNEKSKLKLKRELTRLSVLNHPGIIRVFGLTYFTGGKLAIVMERASESLPTGTFLNSTTLRYAISVVNALLFLHSRDIVHGDIKPANILIVNGVAKVSDFGGAKSLIDVQSMNSTLEFSPKYGAPEQLQSSVTKESDVFSLGLLLYEILCGKDPFEGKTMYQILGSKTTNLELNFSSHVPTPLQQLILGCLKHDQCERPTLGEIHELLQDLINHHCTEPEPSNQSHPRDESHVNSSFESDNHERLLSLQLDKVRRELVEAREKYGRALMRKENLEDLKLSQESYISSLKVKLEKFEDQNSILLEKLDSKQDIITQLRENLFNNMSC